MKNIPQELLNELQEASNKNEALLLSFIAPDKIVRTSPVAFDYASISIADFYNIEKIIEPLKEDGKLPKKLHLIIQTPGGLLGVSTKIAKYLRSSFSEIIAFVPYEAASGGTMMCLAANSIIMGSTSNLTPIDPQVSYKGQRIAATTYEQAIEDLEKKFAKYRPEEMPSPYQQLCNQFDPVIKKEMSKIVVDTLGVAFDLLNKSQKPKNSEEKSKILDTVFALGKNAYPHSHIIDIDEARAIGLNINNNQEIISLLKTYKKWVICRLQEEVTYHIIDVVTPKKYEKADEIKDETKQNK